MNKDELLKSIDEGLTQRQIAKRFGKSQGSIKHWLKKYELKTISKPMRTVEEKRSAKYALQEMHRQKNKQNLYLYLLEHPCVDCGETDQRCLQFDHQRDKKFLVSKAVHGSTRSWKSILEEIEKCEVRCANCHFKRHSTWINELAPWLNGLGDGLLNRAKAM